jgi:hypothetical protein
VARSIAFRARKTFTSTIRGVEEPQLGSPHLLDDF